jgi:flagellar motor switch protein FliG
MPSLDYRQLTRPQKLAVFLICMGPEAAAEVLRQFDDTEVEKICREMAGFPMITEEIRRQAMDEFSDVVSASVKSSLGGMPFARRTLALARGDEEATTILGRVDPVGPSVGLVKDVSDMEGRQIFNLIRNEQPQTIAFLLSYLDPAKAAEVFTFLPQELSEEVIERLGTIESTSLELVGRIVQSLGKHLDAKARPSLHHSGGVVAVAGLLNNLAKDTAKSLLTRIEVRNAALGAAVRKKMFTFEDLVRLANSDLQRVLREVDFTNLTVSMKMASPALREKIYGALSRRAAEGLREEIDLLGPVRVRDIEVAQGLVIQTVRKMEEEGQISLDSQAQALVA